MKDAGWGFRAARRFLVVWIAIVIGSLYASPASATAEVVNGPILDLEKTTVASPVTTYEMNGARYCERRWSDSTPRASSFRLRYELDRVERGWIHSYCASPSAGPDQENLIVVAGDRYTTVPSPQLDDQRSAILGPLDTYSRDPSETRRTAAMQQFSSLPQVEAPVLLDQKKPGRAIIWIPRHHCTDVHLTFVYTTSGSCAADIQRTAKIVEFDSTIDYGKKGYKPPTDLSTTNPLELAYAHRVVRLQWVTPDDRLKFCSGLMLTSSLALTARHCVEDDNKIKDRGCLANDMDCQSYAADVYFTKEGEKASVPIVHAFGGPPSKNAAANDYAFIQLFPSAVVTRQVKDWPKLGGLTRDAEAIRKGRPLVLFAHPLDYYLQITRDCQAFYPLPKDGQMPEGEFMHTCYTLKGSSGGPFWISTLASRLAPIAIHNEVMRDCDDPNGNVWQDNAESFEKEGKWFSIYQQDHSQYSCVGQAVQTLHALCERCLRNTIAACDQIVQAFETDPLALCSKDTVR